MTCPRIHLNRNVRPAVPRRTMTNAQLAGSSSCEFISGMVTAQKRGEPVGIYSVCSANRFVLEASMLQAKEDGTAVCIESTSNQVNQFGGYIGKNPSEFRNFAESVAVEMEFPTDRIILGGDHLGPHVWQHESSAS